MSISSPPTGPNKKRQNANNLAVYTIGGQIGCATLAIILIGLFVGIQLDKLIVTTNHIFTIIFVLGSAPLSLIVTYYLAMRAVKSLNPQQPETPKQNPVEEEEKRE
jgi:F0F1-type ATP synthase assembly protein I